MTEASFSLSQQYSLLHLSSTPPTVCLSTARLMPRPPAALPTLLGIPHRPLAQLAPALISYVHFPVLSRYSLILSHRLKPPALTRRTEKTVKVMLLNEEELSRVMLKSWLLYLRRFLKSWVWKREIRLIQHVTEMMIWQFLPALQCTVMSRLNLLPVLPLGTWTGIVQTGPTVVICLGSCSLSHAKWTHGLLTWQSVSACWNNLMRHEEFNQMKWKEADKAGI